MPLSASILTRVSRRFSKKGLFDISDALAIAAACAIRGDIFGREEWIDAATAKMMKHGINIPATIQSAYFRELGV